mmetsp:Transcript_42654/g.102854  ORF Transcript_42654/g.102854 Transcript_42654/m.102854 type:complete len:269 (-) Transcript_42654:419-1225(-)
MSTPCPWKPFRIVGDQWCILIKTFRIRFHTGSQIIPNQSFTWYDFSCFVYQFCNLVRQIHQFDPVSSMSWIGTFMDKVLDVSNICRSRPFLLYDDRILFSTRCWWCFVGFLLRCCLCFTYLLVLFGNAIVILLSGTVSLLLLLHIVMLYNFFFIFVFSTIFFIFLRILFLLFLVVSIIFAVVAVVVFFIRFLLFIFTTFIVFLITGIIGIVVVGMVIGAIISSVVSFLLAFLLALVDVFVVVRIPSTGIEVRSRLWRGRFDDGLLLFP